MDHRAELLSFIDEYQKMRKAQADYMKYKSTTNQINMKNFEKDLDTKAKALQSAVKNGTQQELF